MIMTGMIATVTMLIILIQASSAIRHAFYEIFVHLHIALIILVLVFLWFHLNGFSQRSYLLAAVIAWVSMRLLRLVTFIKCNLGHEATKATIEILPGNAMRVSVFATRKVQARPGSHFYLYIPSVGLCTSHPFSIAWNDIELPLSRTTSESIYEEKMPVKDIEVDANGRQILSTVIRRRTGFTDSLYRRAEKAGGQDGVKLTLNAYVEAGYGVHQSVLSSCGTVMLFAAGVGITHQIPYVKHLVKGHAAGTVAARRVILVWVTQSPEHLEWIRPWMTQILAMERRREVLLIKLFITQPKDGKEVTSPSATVQMYVSRS
jgi:Ferric reductase NAD binding domain/FAD-binding domain